MEVEDGDVSIRTPSSQRYYTEKMANFIIMKVKPWVHNCVEQITMNYYQNLIFLCLHCETEVHKTTYNF